MFGYVKTDLPNMYMKDVTLYKAMYCGLCKGIGKRCGQRGRMALNYDLTFLSVLLHNVMGKDVKIEKQRCVIHRIRKRPIAVPDELTERIACLNIILARYKLNDDVHDDGKGRFMRAFFGKAYKRAKRCEPELDKIVCECYKDLTDYEKSGGDSVDFSSDPFGRMMSETVKLIAGEFADENLLNLAYYLGKWVYLIDAVDDFDKDKKRKSFNVFVNMHPEIKSKEELMEKHRSEIASVFGNILCEITKCAESLDYKFNHDLTNNVLFSGIRVQTKNILENKKCSNTTKF